VDDLTHVFSKAVMDKYLTEAKGAQLIIDFTDEDPPKMERWRYLEGGRWILEEEREA
jgi:hypothetical protein